MRSKCKDNGYSNFNMYAAQLVLSVIAIKKKQQFQNNIRNKQWSELDNIFRAVATKISRDVKYTRIFLYKNHSIAAYEKLFRMYSIFLSI